ncbi:hypothetical protein ES703_123329 [subsurface metagenome]
MLCLFLPACRPDEAHVDPEPITTLRGQWSEPVDGLSCRIALTKDTLHVGTLSIFHIELKNTSDAPIDLVQPSYTTGQRGQILLTHDGKTYDERNFSRPSDTSYPPPPPPVKIAPGQIHQATHAILINGHDLDGVAKLGNVYGHRPEYPLKALNDWDGFAGLPTGEYQLQYNYNDSVVSPPLSVKVVQPPVAELVRHVLTEARTEGLPANCRATLVEVLSHLT